MGYSDGYNVSFSTIGNREGLTDILTNIDPTTTPFFSSIGRTTANANLVEWQTDTLATAVKTNRAAEGASAEAASASVTTRLTNYTQILSKAIFVSNTQIDGMNPAGRTNEWDYQMKKAAAALARDIEKSLVENSAALAPGNGSGAAMEGLGLHEDASAGDATAVMAGFLSANGFIGATAYGSTSASCRASGRLTLTETLFNDMLQAVWVDGGRPNMILCGGYQKRVISSFSANSTRYSSVSSDSKVLSGSVSVYESDYGVVQIRLSHFVAPTVIGALETQYFKVAVQRPLTFNRLAKDGDREKGQFVTQLTLIASAPTSGGMIRCLASGYNLSGTFSA